MFLRCFLFSPSPEDSCCSIGCEVELRGLQGVFADKNGIRGKVVEWTEDAQKWSVVSLDGKVVMMPEKFLRVIHSKDSMPDEIVWAQVAPPGAVANVWKRERAPAPAPASPVTSNQVDEESVNLFRAWLLWYPGGGGLDTGYLGGCIFKQA